MKQKVLSLVLAAIMLSTSVDVTAFASQTSEVDSAVFMEEAAEEMEEGLSEETEAEPQATSEEVEEEPEISPRGGKLKPH